MKILTITFHRSKNYGAVLQTYALQQALIKCGYETAVIDYYRIISPSASRNPVQFAKKIVLHMLEFLKKKERCEFKNKFASFITDNILLTCAYNNYEALSKNPPQADMYLIGSDQVWNITYRYRPEFFADFAPKNIPVASYAASIGKYDYNDEQMELFKKGIQKVSPISVRERQGVLFLKENFHLNAEHHLDPVFLLKKEEWEKMCVKPDIEEKYILCYALTNSRLMHSAAKKLKKLTGYRVVSISLNANNFIRGDINVFNAGPKEFLGYICDAEFILTTSFHGTAFSIIFEKKFYNFTSEYYSSRTNDLLDLLELTDRIPKSLNDISIKDINYTETTKRRASLVEQSYRYLRSLEKRWERK